MENTNHTRRDKPNANNMPEHSNYSNQVIPLRSLNEDKILSQLVKLESGSQVLSKIG